MKAINDLIEKCLRLNFNDDVVDINDVIQDLETLKEQLKEQHKEDVVEAFNRGNKEGLCNVISLKFKLDRRELEAEQYYQQTQEKKCKHKLCKRKEEVSVDTGEGLIFCKYHNLQING